MSPKKKKQKPSKAPTVGVETNQTEPPGEPAPKGPLFALGVDQAHASHPDALALLEAYTRFKAGDFQATREHLNAIDASESDTPKSVLDAASELRSAMALDPVTIIFAITCLVLFSIILALVY